MSITAPFILSDVATDDESFVYIFAHGLASTWLQGLSTFTRLSSLASNAIYNPHWMLKNPVILFNFPDAKNDNKIEWHAHQVNLGQEHDIAALAEAYNYAVANFPGRSIVLGGVSRGASTIVNFVATAQPKNVKALILESPFDSFNSVVKHLLHQFYLGWIPFSDNLAMKYMEHMFPRINIKGIVPQLVVHTISHEIPILFLHSKIDKTVPINASRNLYMKLRLAGHTNVHIFELETGHHARLLKGTEGYLCHTIIHSFLKKYGLPHDIKAAENGFHFFLRYCQPSLEEIKKKIKQYRSPSLTQYIPDDVLLDNIEIDLV